MSGEKVWRESGLSSICEALVDSKNHWILSAVTSGSAFEIVNRKDSLLPCTPMMVIPPTGLMTGIAGEGAERICSEVAAALRTKQLTLYSEICKSRI